MKARTLAQNLGRWVGGAALLCAGCLGGGSVLRAPGPGDGQGGTGGASIVGGAGQGGGTGGTTAGGLPGGGFAGTGGAGSGGASGVAGGGAAGAAGAAGAGGVMPGTGAYALEKAFCVDETNRYRAMVGRPPLARSAELEAFADQGAEMASASRRAHGHFIATSGGGIASAENEVPWWDGGPNDVRSVVEMGLALMWSEGPGGGHYDNIVGNHTSVGCGIYAGNGTVTVTQDFGR